MADALTLLFCLAAVVVWIACCWAANRRGGGQ